MTADAAAVPLLEAGHGGESLPPVPELAQVNSPTEMTAVEMVRSARQEGSDVEDDSASSSAVGFSSPVSQQALAEASKPRRRRMASSSSAPSLIDPDNPGGGTPSPKAKPRRRRRVVSSVSAPDLGSGSPIDPECLEHTRLPPIEPHGHRRIVQLQPNRGRASSEPTRRPGIPQQPNRSRVRSDCHDNRPSMPQDELRNLPVAEALRQVLIERNGTLKQAYKAMDVNGTGVLNTPAEFDKGLLRGRVFGSPLVGYRDASDLFKGIDPSRRGFISLHEFLGYMPICPKSMKLTSRSRDTNANWLNYNNNASAQKSRLARQPRWKEPEQAKNFDEEPDFDIFARQRRELREQFEHARQRGGLNMEAKRRLVKGLVAHEDRDIERLRHDRNMIEQKKRIGEAMHSCSRARSELVMLQQAMVSLSPKPKRCKRQASHDEKPTASMYTQP